MNIEKAKEFLEAIIKHAQFEEVESIEIMANQALVALGVCKTCGGSKKKWLSPKIGEGVRRYILCPDCQPKPDDLEREYIEDAIEAEESKPEPTGMRTCQRCGNETMAKWSWCTICHKQEQPKPEPQKIFKCKHFKEYSQSVPTPFGSGNSSEPLSDCVIESASEDCTVECPDYEENPPKPKQPSGEFVKELRGWADALPVSSEGRKDLNRAADYIDRLEQEKADAKKSTFGFMIKENETLLEGMQRNYAEFDDERTRLNKIVKQQAERIKEFENDCGRMASEKIHLRLVIKKLEAKKGE